VETTLALRVALLRAEYAHFIADPEALHKQLGHLTALRGAAATARWRAMTAAGEWDALVEDLLVEHYDPAYLRSMRLNYPEYDGAAAAALQGIGEADFAQAAARITAAYGK
jgi:tRNA 2-selenouridine synthase